MEVDGEARPFLLFSKPKSNPKPEPEVQNQPEPQNPNPASAVETDGGDSDPAPTVVTESGDSDDADDADAAAPSTFADLGLSQWLVDVCDSLGMRRPTTVQRQCIPRALKGEDVLGIAETGSGKTAAFALPILHRLGEDPFGVAALALAPTRELAAQLAEQFRALGSPLGLRCLAAIGGFDTLGQAKGLARRPHVVVATPGRIATLITNDPDLAKVFSRTKFLVLDEADRVLDVNFEEDLRVIFGCLPKKRQTFLFSATMSDNLRSLLELSGNKKYLFEAYEGFKTVETLKQQYIHIPPDGKELHLLYLLSKMNEDNIRSSIIFVSTCRTCQYLDFLLEELGRPAVSLHSHKSQSRRLSALHRFKSGQVPVLVATDVASRGLDIQTVDLVINYDIPRYPRDYIHRVGRTARATRGGLSISFVTQERKLQLISLFLMSTLMCNKSDECNLICIYQNLLRNCQACTFIRNRKLQNMNVSYQLALAYGDMHITSDQIRNVHGRSPLKFLIKQCLVFVSMRYDNSSILSETSILIEMSMQRDICLLHEIEDVVGKQLDAYEFDDRDVTKDITKVFKARRLANMKMADEGHDEKVQARKEQKKRALARKRKHEE